MELFGAAGRTNLIVPSPLGEERGQNQSLNRATEACRLCENAIEPRIRSKLAAFSWFNMSRARANREEISAYAQKTFFMLNLSNCRPTLFGTRQYDFCHIYQYIKSQKINW
jgi:hypothetical protein